MGRHRPPRLFRDRLKVYLREKGARHDLIDAVFALPGQDDLLMIVRRVEALGNLLDTEDGKNLLAGYRRAAKILRAEEGRTAPAPSRAGTIRPRSRCRPKRTWPTFSPQWARPPASEWAGGFRGRDAGARGLASARGRLFS